MSRFTFDQEKLPQVAEDSQWLSVFTTRASAGKALSDHVLAISAGSVLHVYLLGADGAVGR
jgi:hypothetical protein